MPTVEFQTIVCPDPGVPGSVFMAAMSRIKLLALEGEMETEILFVSLEPPLADTTLPIGEVVSTLFKPINSS